MLVPKKWVKKHDKDVTNKMMDLIKVELDEYFKKTHIEKYRLEYYSFKNYKYLVNSLDSVIIIPIKPVFDEDYGGEYDDDVAKIGKKYGIDLQFTSDIYGK